MTPPRISSRVSSLRPTVVNRILSEVRAYQQGGGQPISLMRGEPDLATPIHIVDAANRALANGRTAYPNNQGEPLLRQAIARKLNRQQTGDYSPDEEVLITTGATLGVYAALAAVLDVGDEVLLPEPVYDAYLSVVLSLGGIARQIPAKIDNGRFALAADDFASVCGSRTRAMLLNTPWNPTGTVLSRDELARLMSVAQQHDLVVISDEIYESIVYPPHRSISPVVLSDDARQRTIIVNSFSKTYAMTGWRLGYCAGPAVLIRAMYLVLQQSSRGPATFVQDAGVEALDGPQDCVAEMQAIYSDRRQLVCDALSPLPNVDVIVPEGGFFAMLDVRRIGLPSDEIRKRLLTEFGVVVVHGSAYGPSAEGTLRVTFATGGDNLKQGLERLSDGLAAIES